jgi:spore coat protein U-like protein
MTQLRSETRNEANALPLQAELISRMNIAIARWSQKRALGLAAIFLLAGAPAAYSAETCSISMTTVAFGNVDVTTGAAVDTTGTLQVVCSGFTLGVEACLSIGAGSLGDATSRELQSGANTLRYDLYSDAARTTIWGSWESGYKSPGVSMIVNNGTTNVTVYGRVLAAQPTVLAGAYTSTFTANPFLRYGRDNSPACPGPLNHEQTTSTSFSATATVITACSVSTSAVNFGAFASLGSNVDSTGSVSVTCTNGAPYNVGLGAGTGTGATVAARKMTNGANTVTYSLYSNTGRTTVWGNTIGTDTVTGTGSGLSQSLTVYGRVPSQTTPPVKTYTDTVVVTVTF